MSLESKFPPISPIKVSHMTLTTATAEALREAIHQGRFPAGSQLPPEMELMSMLGVSRTTLREALRSLEEQRMIIRRRGLGTFVSERSILKDLSINFGITEMIRQAGMAPGTREAELRRETASPSVAQALQIPRGSAVTVVDRVRTADDRAVVWSLDLMPGSIFGEHDIEPLKLRSISLYQYMEYNLGVHISRGEAVLSPVLASAEVAVKLNVRPGTPLVHVAQTDYNSDDRPVLHSIEHHLPDAFVFIVNRRGPHWQ
jgi:GntR family transcriptional regulator